MGSEAPGRQRSRSRAGSDFDAKDCSVGKAWQGYLESLPLEHCRLLIRYRISDAALRVGTRCLIGLLEGARPEDAIILQQKVSGPSALAAYLKPHPFTSEAERVVVGQRLMQASSDIFLGWSKGATGGRLLLATTQRYERLISRQRPWLTGVGDLLDHLRRLPGSGRCPLRRSDRHQKLPGEVR